MLLELHIENYVLIDSLDLSFLPGLNVITGETGTGKSVLLDAITLLGGGRGLSEQVKSDSSEAIIQGAFTVKGYPHLEELLKEKGLETDQEGSIVLTRRIQLNGPNKCRANGQLISLADLTDIGSALMDIQSQGEHYSLLRSKEHLRILDSYAGEQVSQVKAHYEQTYLRFQELRGELRRTVADAQERAREIDMLKFQVQEIAAAGFRKGEDEELKERRNILRNSEKLAQETSKAYGLIKQGFGELPGALDSLQEAAASLEKVARIDPSWEDVLGDYQALLTSLDEIGDRLRNYLDGLYYDSSELDQLEARLALADTLKRKYGPALSDVLNYLERAEKQLKNLEESDQRKDELESQLAQVTKELRRLGEELREKRLEAAKKLENAVAKGLSDLKFTGAEFRVQLSPVEGFQSTGLDEVEFLFSANPGESLKSLAKVASGGELSRLLLTLKGALAAAEEVPVLIFDEIDIGTSGRAAQAIAEKLFELSRNYQVICVTHLPQIAAMGEQHILLEKEINEAADRTKIGVRILSKKERVNELARLLGGVAVSEATLQASRDLLKQAERYKSSY